MDNLVCPLCKSNLTYRKALTDDSGRYLKATVSCPCGFTFSKPGYPKTRIGESDWDAIARDISEVDSFLKDKFSKVES